VVRWVGIDTAEIGPARNWVFTVTFTEVAGREITLTHISTRLITVEGSHFDTEEDVSFTIGRYETRSLNFGWGTFPWIVEDATMVLTFSGREPGGAEFSFQVSTRLSAEGQ
jgi:hypothetical protein